MTFGISTIKNGLSETIIDQEHKPLRVTHSGTVSKTTFAFDGESGEYKIPVPPGMTLPMLFVEWPIGTNLINFGVNGGYYQIINSDNNGPSTLKYHLCTFAEPVSLGGYGVEIYNSAGELTFTTSQSYVRIKELVQLGGPDTTTNHSSFANGKPVTVPLPVPARSLLSVGSHAQWYMSTVRRKSTTQFETVARGTSFGIVDNVTTPNLPFTFGPSLVVLGDF